MTSNSPHQNQPVVVAGESLKEAAFLKELVCP
jgi:hypothetical protein